MTTTSRPGPLRTLARAAAVASALAALPAGAALAHGTHARFLAPERRAVVTEALEIHVAKEATAFPYVRVSVRPHRHAWAAYDPIADGAAEPAEVWSGIVPLDSAGYVQVLDISDWRPGLYVVEAGFLGDIVEQTQSVVFTVKEPKE